MTVDFNNGKDITYFATQGLAELAVRWAYEVRLSEVKKRADASEIKTEQDSQYEDGGTSIKLVWWKEVVAKAMIGGINDRVGGGFIAQKDYFYVDREVIEREVID